MSAIASGSTLRYAHPARRFPEPAGDLTVRRGDRKSQLPMHESRKELGKGLVNKILKGLGLK